MISRNIRIVLVGPTHPGNIGAAARAMKNMSLDRLFLVQPKIYPSAEATARASGADDLLAACRVCDTLDEAIDGCSLVAATTARVRALRWPQYTPREAGERIVTHARQAEVAVLFGREHSGLTNEELDRCQWMINIPSNPAFSSLNLGAAVQVICYEILSATPAQAFVDTADEFTPFATAEEIEHYYRHLETVLARLDFLDPANPRHLMRRLRRLYNRAQLDRNETNILRGILTAIERKIT
jgi:TrmH family RNA methyltransferase